MQWALSEETLVRLGTEGNLATGPGGGIIPILLRKMMSATALGLNATRDSCQLCYAAIPPG